MRCCGTDRTLRAANVGVFPPLPWHENLQMVAVPQSKKSESRFCPEIEVGAAGRVEEEDVHVFGSDTTQQPDQPSARRPGGCQNPSAKLSSQQSQRPNGP